jgi:hypothetical protein
MLEILWSVVDSQLASSEPLREPPGPASGPACTGRAKVVTGYPKRLLPNACTTPAQASSILLACHRPTPSAAGTACTFPAADPPRRACGQPLNQRYNAQHHTPQGGAAQPLADPVWGPALRRRVRGRRGTQADDLAARALPAFSVCPGRAGPRESGPGGPPPTCTMRTFSPSASGRACGPDLHEARRRLSAAPQRRRHPPGQSCRVRAPRWHADASRHQRIRPARALLPARRAAGSAEVDDQAQNVRWRNPACCHRAAMRIIIGRGGQKPPGRTAPESACPPNVRARPALTGSLLAWT